MIKLYYLDNKMVDFKDLPKVKKFIKRVKLPKDKNGNIFIEMWYELRK